MKILVIGATGLIGAPVVQHLSESGHQVRVFARNIEKARARLGSSFEYLPGEIDNFASLESAARGCDAIHLSLNGRSDPDLERRGAENAVRAAKSQGLRLISLVSGATVSRENCWYPGTQAKFQAEEAVRTSGLPHVIFRPTFFMETLPRLVQGNRASILGRQPAPLRWVAARDFARMVAQACTVEDIRQTVYVYGPQALTMQQALQAYCDVVHPGLKASNLPFWMAEAIATLSGSQELKQAIPFFRYIEKTSEAGSPREANPLLGTPSTTLQEWLKSHQN